MDISKLINNKQIKLMPQFLRFMLGFLDFSAQALSKLFGEYLTGVLNFNRQVSPVVRKESFFFLFFFF